MKLRAASLSQRTIVLTLSAALLAFSSVALAQSRNLDPKKAATRKSEVIAISGDVAIVLAEIGRAHV